MRSSNLFTCYIQLHMSIIKMCCTSSSIFDLSFRIASFRASFTNGRLVDMLFELSRVGDNSLQTHNLKHKFDDGALQEVVLWGYLVIGNHDPLILQIGMNQFNNPALVTINLLSHTVTQSVPKLRRSVYVTE